MSVVVGSSLLHGARLHAEIVIRRSLSLPAHQSRKAAPLGSICPCFALLSHIVLDVSQRGFLDAAPTRPFSPASTFRLMPIVTGNVEAPELSLSILPDGTDASHARNLSWSHPQNALSLWNPENALFIIFIYLSLILFIHLLTPQHFLKSHTGPDAVLGSGSMAGTGHGAPAQGSMWTWGPHGFNAVTI